MTTPQEREAARRAEAAEALGNARDGGSLFDGGLADPAQRALAHFRADDAPDDPLEIWGRRIGRALALIVAIGLVLYLYTQLYGTPRP
jgi:ferric-dicitrate binding protein FerR (iron transport regulator)